MMYEISKTLIRLGLALILIGVIVRFIPRFDFAPLPGDIVIRRENFTFYLPITTMILISLLLTVFANLFFRK
ncbi:DUF2905 domain-containing protein [Candidatus Babeliales bacterium]|nr:DUF2905 domain-containing protein [Candidatus Babeliales bacterium]